MYIVKYIDHQSVVLSTLHAIEDTGVAYLFDMMPIVEEYEIDRIKKLIQKRNLIIYLRCSDQLNIARGDDIPYSMILQQVKYATQMGFRGVLIHTGRYSNLERSKALYYLREHLDRLLSYATLTCPLLLQNCIKKTKTSELLSYSNEMISFVESFQHANLGVALDLDHIDQPISSPTIRFIYRSASTPQEVIDYYHSIPTCNTD